VPPWADDGDWSIAQARLRLVRHVVTQDPPPGLAAGLERAERLFPLLHAARPAICHGDFHPANLLTGSGQVAVIDWTDTGTGDRHADLARTLWVFRFAAAAAHRRWQRLALGVLAPVLSRACLAAYQRELPVDPVRLRMWRPLHLLHAWA